MGKKRALVSNIYLPSGIQDIAFSKIKLKDYGNFYMDFWIYVKALPENEKYDKDNYKNKSNITGNPKGCILQSSDSNLSIDLYSDATLAIYTGRKNADVNPTEKKPSLISRDFPVQKWIYVVVSIQNSTLVDLYINGKLIQSANYNGTFINKLTKTTSSESLQFGKKLDAYINSLRINTDAATTGIAWKNYLEGNNSSVTKMNISLNLTQNSKVSNSVQLL